MTAVGTSAAALPRLHRDCFLRMWREATLATCVRLLAAIELLVAAQACTLRNEPLAAGIAWVMDAVRSVVPPLDEDRPSAPDIRALDALIAMGAFDRTMPGTPA